MATYSFKNFKCTFVGPGVGAFSLGSDAGLSKEGLTVAMDEDKTKTDTGAGGDVMHSVNASDTGTIRVRLLKTSPTNALLNAAYNFQKTNVASAGQNVIRGADTARGDVVSATQLAFVKQPDLTYASEAGMNEWQFRGVIFEKLGTGVPSLT
jgi:structural protein KPP10_ORF10